MTFERSVAMLVLRAAIGVRASAPRSSTSTSGRIGGGSTSGSAGSSTGSRRVLRGAASRRRRPATGQARARELGRAVAAASARPSTSWRRSPMRLDGARHRPRADVGVLPRHRPRLGRRHRRRRSRGDRCLPRRVRRARSGSTGSSDPPQRHRSELGSRTDRHEHLGAGRIGPSGLGHVLRHPGLAHAPAIIETPGMDVGYDAINLARAGRCSAAGRSSRCRREAFELAGSARGRDRGRGEPVARRAPNPPGRRGRRLGRRPAVDPLATAWRCRCCSRSPPCCAARPRRPAARGMPTRATTCSSCARSSSDGIVPLLGPPTSIGDVHHGAWYYYLLSAGGRADRRRPAARGRRPHRARRDPRRRRGVVAGARRSPARSPALVAGLVLATSAAAIDESTFIWNPNLIALSSAVALAAAWRAWTGRDARWWVVAAIGTAVTMQCHVLGVALLPVVACPFLARRSAPAARMGRVPLAVRRGLRARLTCRSSSTSSRATSPSSRRERVPDRRRPPGADVALPVRLRIVAAAGPQLAADRADHRRPRRRRPGDRRDDRDRGLAMACARPLVSAWRRAGSGSGLLWTVAFLTLAAPSLAGVVRGLPNDHYHAFADPMVVVLVGIGRGGARPRGAGRPLGAASRPAASWSALVGWNLAHLPPAVNPDGGYPAARAGRGRASMRALTAAGITRTTSSRCARCRRSSRPRRWLPAGAPRPAIQARRPTGSQPATPRLECCRRRRPLGARRDLCDRAVPRRDRRGLRGPGGGAGRARDSACRTCADRSTVRGRAGPLGVGLRRPAPPTADSATADIANAGAPDAGVRCPRDPDGGGRPGSCPGDSLVAAGSPAGGSRDGADRADRGRSPTWPLGLMPADGERPPADRRARSADRTARRALVRRCRCRSSRRLEGAAEAAHPDGEVVLHDLADLRLGQQVVGAQRVLDARGRVGRSRRRRGPGTAACRRRRGARGARGRAWSRCRATASDRRGSAGRSSSGRRPTAGPIAAATSSWP